MSSNEDTKASIQHAFIRQISLLRHLNRWLIYTWQYAVALAVLQTFCFSWHKLHRKRFVFPWLHTFETETSVLHNSIPRNLFNSSSWLTWFLHISLSNSTTWQNMFSYHTYIYHGLRNHLLSQLDELYTFQLMACAGLSIRHTLHVHSITILTITPPIHHTTLSRLSYYIPALSLSRVLAMIRASHDQSVPIQTNTASLFMSQNVSVKDRHSQTFHPSRLNNYTHTYGGTIISPDITNHYDALG